METLHLFLLLSMTEYRRSQQERLWHPRNENEIPFTAERPVHVLQAPAFKFRTTQNMLRLFISFLVQMS